MEQKLAKLFKVLSKGESDYLATPTTPTQPRASRHPDTPSGEDISASLLLELAFLCVENSLYDLARDCLHQVPKERVQSDPKQYLLRELLNAQLQTVQWDGTKQLYSKTAVEMRLNKIDQLEEILKSALRLSDPDIIQVSVGHVVIT